MANLKLLLGNILCSSCANVFMKGAWHPFLLPFAFVLNSISYCFLYSIYANGEDMIVAQTLISSSQIMIGSVAGVIIFDEQCTRIRILAIIFALSATFAMFIASFESRSIVV